MEQPKVRMLQRRELGSPDAAIGKLPHQTRMFFFPLRPHGRVFENTPRDQLLVVVGTRKRRLYAISGYAHESRVTDGMAEHSSLLNPRFWQMRGLALANYIPSRLTLIICNTEMSGCNATKTQLKRPRATPYAPGCVPIAWQHIRRLRGLLVTTRQQPIGQGTQRRSPLRERLERIQGLPVQQMNALLRCFDT